MSNLNRNILLERILSAIGSGGSALWGSISGSIQDQTDLQTQFKTVEPVNTKVINTAGDLPPAIGGFRTLEANTKYRFAPNVDLGTDYLDVSARGISIVGSGLQTVSAIYTGSQPVIKGPSISISEFVLLQPTGNADLLEIDGTSSDFVFLTDVLLAGNGTPAGGGGGYGTIANVGDVGIRYCGSFDILQGLKLVGSNWDTVVIDNLNLESTNPAFVGLDITGVTLETFRWTNGAIQTVSGAIGIKGDAGSVNIPSPNVGILENVSVFGGGVGLSGLSVDDVGFEFVNCRGIGDSKVVAHCYIDIGDEEVTPITGGVEVQLEGLFTNGSQTSQASTDAVGNITVLNRIAGKGVLNVDLDISKSGGAGQTDDYIFRLKQDVGGLGSPVTIDGAFKTAEISGSASAQISMTVPVDYHENDEFFVTVEGVGTDDDITAVTNGFKLIGD